MHPDHLPLGTGIRAGLAALALFTPGIANAHLIREWGDAVADEWETRLGLQTRYRFSPLWEPAIEFHAAEDLRALGPALLGSARLGGRRKLHGEAGLFAGLDTDSSDLSVRGQLEYEF